MVMKIERLIKGTEKGFFPFVRFMDRITWVVLFFMMCMTSTDVILRKTLNQSIIGSVELTEMLLTVVIFCALAQCQLNNGHIQVDLIYKKLSPRLQKICDLITQSLCTVLFALIAIGTFRHGMEMHECGEVSLDLEIPIYPFVYLASSGCALLAIVLLLKALAALREMIES